MKKRLFIHLLLLFSLIFISCDLCFTDIKTIKLENNFEPMEEISAPDTNNRLWNILIYMAADNNLEYSAIEDIFEMEVSKLNTKNVSVFILLDRSPEHDTSNNDWSDTRLLKLKTGRSENCKTIISEELNFYDLNLYQGSCTELDMSSGEVLSKVLSYIRKQYPAEYNGLVMWGHGTGWRGNAFKNNVNEFKAFAYDNTSGSYMTLMQFRESLEAGLNGQKLDFIGLDTCFSGELEVMYELQNCANFIVGTEGLLSVNGWNYETIFNCFNKSKDKSVTTLLDIIVNTFAEEYKRATSASIVAIKTEFIEEYFKSFDKAAKLISEEIKNREIRDAVMNILFDNRKSTKYYSYGVENSDIYLDINSMFLNLNNYFISKENINIAINEFYKIKDKCVIYNWSSDTPAGGLGIFFGVLTKGNMIGAVHPNMYIKNNGLEHIKFVNNSNGYVYDLNKNEGLIYKLFYENYQF